MGQCSDVQQAVFGRAAASVRMSSRQCSDEQQAVFG